MKRNENTRFSKKLFALALIFVMLVSTCVVYAEEETTENPADNLILDDYEGYWRFSGYGSQGGIFWIEAFPEKMSIRTGDRIYLSTDAKFCDGTSEHLFDCKAESSDETIFTVDGAKSSETAKDKYIEAVNPGVATLKIVHTDIVHENGSYYYVEDKAPHYVEITVLDRKTLASDNATVISQVKSGLDNCTPYVYSNKVEVAFKPTNPVGHLNDTIFELWRSTSKNGKYKKVASATLLELREAYDDYNGYGLGGQIDDDTYYLMDHKKVKANTKYYYKIRSRYTYADAYSEFSNVKIYWTAPKTKYNISYNKSLGRYSWKKVKNVSGYVYWVDVEGSLKWNTSYTDVYHETLEFGYRTTKTYAKKGLKVSSVSPYRKHGDYYYMDNHALTKYKSNLEDWEYQGDKVKN